MKEKSLSRRLGFLIIGDVAVLALVTAIGFASHGTLGSAGTRFLATFIPLLVGWFLVGPHLGVFDQERLTEPLQLWRPFWAMLLAAPLATWLRGVWLNSPILPLFVAIMGATSALGLLVWRGLYLLFARRKAGLPQNGIRNGFNE